MMKSLLKFTSLNSINKVISRVVERRSVQVVITANENYTWERFPTNQEPDIHYQSDNDEKSLEIYQLELN
jgi:hypothetical protein